MFDDGVCAYRAKLVGGEFLHQASLERSVDAFAGISSAFDQQRYSKLLSIHGYLKEQTQYSASDAHCPEQIGTQPSIWQTEELTFDGLRKAFDQKDNHLIFASHG